MGAPIKAMKVGTKPLTKGGLAQAVSDGTDIKKALCGKAFDKIAEIAVQQLKGAGKFVLPGVCMIKTRLKPATKAGKREVFGKVVMVKARPARSAVKAFPVAALKKAF